MGKSRQICQTENTKRWRNVKWSSRIIIFCIVLLFGALALMMKLDKNPQLPFHEDFKAVIPANKTFLQENKISEEYQGFRGFIHDKAMNTTEDKITQAREDRVKNQSKNWCQLPAGIRSALYLAWGSQSLMSLKRNIKHLNLVFREWFFIDPKTGDLKT